MFEYHVFRCWSLGGRESLRRGASGRRFGPDGDSRFGHGGGRTVRCARRPLASRRRSTCRDVKRERDPELSCR